MARPRIHTFWRSQICTLFENNPGMRAPTIRRKLERIRSSPKDAGNVPDERTIRRIGKEFSTLREEERKPYQYFRWPDSMEQGLLPWEAARDALDLVRILSKHGTDRPTIAHALWYWRLTLAAPESDLYLRVIFTWMLSLVEAKSSDAVGRRALDAARASIEEWLIKQGQVDKELEAVKATLWQQCLTDAFDKAGNIKPLSKIPRRPQSHHPRRRS